MDSYKVLLAGVVVSLCAAGAQPRQRIRGEIDESTRFVVAGNMRPSIARAQDQGPVDGALPLSRMSIHFAMTPTQNADLQQLLRLQQTRHSTEFHKWLTPEQFADRFGLNEKDTERVKAWLEGAGFTNVETARSRNVISFDGTAAQAQTAFHTSIHNYVLNGVKHYANASEPELPKALNGMVEGIRGMTDFHPKPHLRAHFTSSISGLHFLTPDDFATIYDLKSLYGSGFDGTGRTIAIPGQTDLALTDIQAFRAAAGLSATIPQVILTGMDPGTSTSDQGEADLDVEWSGGIAKNASIIYVNSTDVFTSVTYAITNNLADVLSITYGDCEVDTGATEITSLNSMFAQASAQGMTVTAASGDDGAADCDGDTATATTVVTVAKRGLAVDYPGSSPNVTAVGGTTLSEGTGNYWNTTNNANGGSAISYIPEVAWNDTSTTNGLEASGGGASTFNTKPSWQTGTGVPSDGDRDVPDISLTASPNNDGYLICSGGTCVNGFRNTDTTLNVSGGTSAASPSFGAIVAILDQQTGVRQGNVNQNLYILASLSTNAIHDIASGNNIVPCSGGTPNCSSTVANVDGTLGYSTGVGYDQVTGLGSVDGAHMVSEWGADISASITPTTLSVARSTSGTATVNVKEKDYTGAVTFTCSVASPLTNTTCSIPGTFTGSGSETLTITAGATAAAPGWRGVPPLPGLYLLMGLLMATSTFLITKQKKMRVLSAAFGLMLVVGLSSCGSGNSSSSEGSTGTGTAVAAAETGVVTVVATSGSLSSTATVSVTVQ